MKVLLGYTLVDVFITMTMICILCSISYPAYVHYLHVSRRSDAHISILKIANLQEQYFLYHHKYLSLDELTEFSNSDLSLSEKGYYRINIEGRGSSYLISAEVLNSQSSDSACTKLTLDNSGLKGSTSGQDCW